LSLRRYYAEPAFTLPFLSPPPHYAAITLRLPLLIRHAITPLRRLFDVIYAAVRHYYAIIASIISPRSPLFFIFDFLFAAAAVFDIFIIFSPLAIFGRCHYAIITLAPPLIFHIFSL
jgi:hypothetical protein